MTTYRFPALLWTATVAGLLLALLFEAWIESLGLVMVSAPLLALTAIRRIRAVSTGGTAPDGRSTRVRR